MKSFGKTMAGLIAITALVATNFHLTDDSIKYASAEAAKGGNSGGGNSGGGNSGGGKSHANDPSKETSNNASNASDRAKEVANARSAVGKAASAEEQARLEAELAELERLLLEEGLRLQANGTTVNFNLDAVSPTEPTTDQASEVENDTDTAVVAAQ